MSSYDRLSVSELKQLCRHKDLHVSGSRADLIYRLNENKSRGSLREKTLYELKTLCKKKGLPVTGNKDDLIRRMSSTRGSSSSSKPRASANVTPQKKRKRSITTGKMSVNASGSKKRVKKEPMMGRGLYQQHSSVPAQSFYAPKPEPPRHSNTWLRMGAKTKMGFGKHHKLTYMEVFTSKKGYCNWALSEKNADGDLLLFKQWLLDE